MSAAAIGWLWAVIGCCLGVRWGHQRPALLVFVAVVWPICLFVAICQWVDEKAQEGDY